MTTAKITQEPELYEDLDEEELKKDWLESLDYFYKIPFDEGLGYIIDVCMYEVSENGVKAGYSKTYDSLFIQYLKDGSGFLIQEGFPIQYGFVYEDQFELKVIRDKEEMKTLFSPFFV